MLINLISVAFFSTWQQYMMIFLHCARFNPDVRFTLITNLDETHPSWKEQFGDMTKPSNVVFTHYTFEQLVAVINEDNLGLGMSTKLQITTTYKLIDYKPMFGRLFHKELEGFSHWGWFDLDVHIGDVKATYECGYANEDIISYDQYRVHGPLMIMRNTELVNDFYLNALYYPKAITALQSPDAVLFDESHLPYMISHNHSVVLRRLRHRNCDSYIWMWYKGMMRNALGPCVIHHFGGGGPTKTKKNKKAEWNRVKAYFSGYHKDAKYGHGFAQKTKVGSFSFVFTFSDNNEFEIVNTTSAPDFDIKRYTLKYMHQFRLMAAKFHLPNGQCNISAA